MTKTVIEMAREAGGIRRYFGEGRAGLAFHTIKELERFADLVREDEQNKPINKEHWQRFEDAIREDEREKLKAVFEQMKFDAKMEALKYSNPLQEFAEGMKAQKKQVEDYKKKQVLTNSEIQKIYDKHHALGGCWTDGFSYERAIIEAAVLAEREACAKLCEELAIDFPIGSSNCAAAIRARTTKETT